MLLLAGLCMVAAIVIVGLGVAIFSFWGMYLMDTTSVLVREGVIDLDKWSSAAGPSVQRSVRDVDEALGVEVLRSVHMCTTFAGGILLIPAIVLVWLARPSKARISPASLWGVLSLWGLISSGMLLTTAPELLAPSYGCKLVDRHWTQMERAGAIDFAKWKHIFPTFQLKADDRKGAVEWTLERLKPLETGVYVAGFACFAIGLVGLLGMIVASKQDPRGSG